MEYNEEELQEMAEELRRKLSDPAVMREVMKDAYIPVGRSTADMIDEVLQNTDLTGEPQEDEP